MNFSHNFWYDYHICQNNLQYNYNCMWCSYFIFLWKIGLDQTGSQVFIYSIEHAVSLSNSVYQPAITAPNYLLPTDLIKFSIACLTQWIHILINDFSPLKRCYQIYKYPNWSQDRYSISKECHAIYILCLNILAFSLIMSGYFILNCLEYNIIIVTNNNIITV